MKWAIEIICTRNKRIVYILIFVSNGQIRQLLKRMEGFRFWDSCGRKRIAYKNKRIFLSLEIVSAACTRLLCTSDCIHILRILSGEKRRASVKAYKILILWCQWLRNNVGNSRNIQEHYNSLPQYRRARRYYQVATLWTWTCERDCCFYDIPHTHMGWK